MADTGFDWGSLLSTAAKAALAYYAAKSSSSPGKFTQIPEDPILVDLRKKDAGFVDNSPTRNMYASLLQPRLANAPGWQAAPAKYGYAPSGVTAPKYDFSKIFGQPKAAAAAPTGGPETSGKMAANGLKPAAVEPPPNRDIVFDDEFGGGGGPNDGESIYDYYSRNPGGRAQDYLPNQGQSGTTPYQQFVNSPEMAALQQEYGNDASGKKLLSLAAKYGPSILISYFTGNLAPIAMAIYKRLSGVSQTPPPSPPPTPPQPPPDEP